MLESDCKDAAKNAQAILRALADPHRYTLLRAIAANACSGSNTNCTALVDCMGIAQSTLSHHMKELRKAGLVIEHREGRTVSYHLNREMVDAFLTHLRADLLSL